MIVFFGALLIIICSGLGIVSYITASKALTDNTKQVMPQMADEAAKIVEERLNSILTSLETIAAMDNIKTTDMPWSEKVVFLNNEALRKGHIRMGIADKGGMMKTTENMIIDISDMDFFKRAINEQRAVSDPEKVITDNTTTVNYAVPIKNGGQVVGVLVATRDGNNLSKITNEIRFGKTGRAYMINKKGVIIAHYDDETVKNSVNIFEDVKNDSKLQSLADLHKMGVEGHTSAGEYWYKGVAKFSGFAPIVSTGWTVYVTAPKDEVLSGLGVLGNSMLIISLLFLLIGLTTVYLVARNMSKGIAAASEGIDTLAKGDFTLKLSEEYLKRKDEVGKIAQSLEIMQDSIKKMILSVRESSDSIDRQSENLSAVAQQMSSSAEEVTSAIQDVAKGTGTQAEDLVGAVSILNKFGDELEGIVQSIKDVDINSKEINIMAKDSGSNMKSLSESVNDISNAFKEFTQKITGLGNNIKQINEITSLINNIADQTNLLALNASIEAARAGEAGRGFAVVADEIRKLAEQAKASSENINKLVGGISAETVQMLKNTDEMNKELSSQVSVINTAVNSFGNIIKAIDGVTPKIERVYSSAMGLNSEKDVILEKIEGVSSIAEEVSASSQQIAASSEEMSASTQEVASSAQTLSSMTKEMMEQVNKFKL